MTIQNLLVACSDGFRQELDGLVRADFVGQPVPVQPGSGLALQEHSDGQDRWWMIVMTASVYKQVAELNNQELTSLLDDVYPSRLAGLTAGQQAWKLMSADQQERGRTEPDLKSDLDEPSAEPVHQDTGLDVAGQDGRAVSCNGHILNLYVHEQDCDNPACPGQVS